MRESGQVIGGVVGIKVVPGLRALLSYPSHHLYYRTMSMLATHRALVASLAVWRSVDITAGNSVTVAASVAPSVVRRATGRGGSGVV